MSGMMTQACIVNEHDELFATIRSGKRIERTESASKSTMASLMGFMEIYSEQFLEWDEALKPDKWMYPHRFSPLRMDITRFRFPARPKFCKNSQEPVVV